MMKEFINKLNLLF